MKYHPLPIAAAYRRFLALAGRLKRLLSSGHFALLPAEQQQQLLSKLRVLFLRLRRVIPQRKLRQALASSALLIGLGSAQAQEFAPGQVNPFNLDLQSSEAFFLPQLVDIDGDGDFDVMATGFVYQADPYVYEQGVFYFENIGTSEQPSFAEPLNAPFGIEGDFYYSVLSFADMDGDGDQDIVLYDYNEYGQNGLYYLENIGSPGAPAFSTPELIPADPFPELEEEFILPALADMDGDGDLDIMGTYYAFDYDSETELFGFVFIENEGTAQMPAFGEPVLDPFGLQAEEEGYVKFPALSDLDGDGDLDIITGGGYTGEYEQANTFLEYFENTGSSTNPDFASPVVNPSGIEFGTPTYYSYPTTADLDDDGDADLLTFVYYDYESASSGFLYFENLTISGTFDLAEADNHLQLFPTVARDLLSWQYKAQDQPKQLWMEWHDAAGKPVSRQLLHGQQGTAAVQQLAAGQYTARLTDGKGQLLGLRRFVKQ